MDAYYRKTGRFEFQRDHGFVIGPDECHYESEPEAMYFGQFGLCGCGSPEDVHQFLLNCLSSRRDDNASFIDIEKVSELVRLNPDVVAEFVLHFLNARYVIQHGGTVRSSWLTDRGQQLLDVGPMKDLR